VTDQPWPRQHRGLRHRCEDLDADAGWASAEPGQGAQKHITIDPTNTYLLAANQAGDNVVVFRIDHKTGHLTPTGSQQAVPQPGGLAVVKAQ
jgi:6-phosphogluconolactonase (cycloisomerase 2 family)